MLPTYGVQVLPSTFRRPSLAQLSAYFPSIFVDMAPLNLLVDFEVSIYGCGEEAAYAYDVACMKLVCAMRVARR